MLRISRNLLADIFVKGKTIFKCMCCVCAELLSRVQLFATPWIAAHQAPLSMGFSSQEYWSGQPFPTPGDIPDPGIEPGLLHLLHWQADFFTTAPRGKSIQIDTLFLNRIVCLEFYMNQHNKRRFLKLMWPYCNYDSALN